MTVAADIAWGQIRGRRESQQDRAACTSWPNDYHLLLLADGIGGHAAGDTASALAVESFRAAFIGADGLEPRRRLLRALHAANAALAERIRAEPPLAGMGATLLAAALDGGSLRWVSVGDSPLWLFRGGGMRRLNENHSMAAVLDRRAAAGEIAAEEAARSPERSRLLEALLGAELELIDAPAEALPLQPGDTVMLASDGVETCSPEELRAVVAGGASSPADALVNALLQAVAKHDRPAQDNATAIVFKMDAAGAP